MKKNTSYNRDTLLNPHSKLRSASVYIPDLDETFLVRELTAREIMLKDRLEKELPKDSDVVALCYMLVFGVINEDGSYVYTPEDVHKLGENSKETILLLARKITQLTYRVEAKNTLKNAS
jgi:hypothetical protein